MTDPGQLSEDPPGGSRPRRQFRSVSDLRREVTRLYWAVDAGSLDAAEACRRVQILHLVGRLMTESEPEARAREAEAQIAELEARLARTEARLARTEALAATLERAEAA